ncbi:hypothetical protein PTKIN_Ptkin11bG0193400 [Pterospermum kingtungense]
MGCREKRSALKKLWLRKKLDMIFVQETKVNDFSDWMSRWVWGNEAISVEAVGSDGAAGGLLCCWRKDFFSMQSKYTGQRFIMVIGVIKESNFRCGFANVYAPNEDEERKVLWNELLEFMQSSGVPWCIGGILT